MKNSKSRTDNSNSVLSEKEQAWLDSFPVLSEKDFYPPEDNRNLKSGVSDILCGDSFFGFVQEFNELCDEEEIYDDCGSDV